MKSSNLQIVKILLVVAAILIPFEWYLSRIASISSFVSIAIYLVLFVSATASIVLIGFSRNFVVRLFFAAVFAGSALVVESYREVVQEMFSYDAFANMYLAAGFAGDAASQFGGRLAVPILIAMLLFIGTMLPPYRSGNGKRPHFAVVLFPFTTLILLTVVAYLRGGQGLNGQPAAFLPLAYAPLMMLDLSGDIVATPVNLKFDDSSDDFDIVLLIDESIRADYLDFVVSDGLETNLRNHNSIANFGVAAAATNCSFGTNLVLRYGGTRADYRRQIRTSPAIWQYADAIGMTTVYIDGQRTGGRLQNGMTDVELSQIDEFIQFEETPILHRDIEIARLLAGYSRNNRRDLIVVNKVGAHFPVHDKYPNEFMTHTPVLKRGDYEDVSDSGDQSELTDWVRYKNSYKNTLLWNVGEFFRVYLGNADLRNTVMIYTSDHGQNFHDDGSPGFGTHCSSNPSPLEGQVYSIVITEQSEWKDAIQEWSEKNFNRTSHYNIFPTILVLMGYDELSVRSTYGQSMLEISNDDMTFNSAFHARFGRKPEWHKIDVHASEAP